MLTKGEKIRLGVFLLLGFMLVASFVFFTVGRAMLEKNDLYTIEYSESISGLNIGNPVKMRGVSIGKVEELSFDPDDVNKIVVKISVSKDMRIRSDAEAVIEVFGITGLKFIDIVKGSNTALYLRPGDKIKAGVSTFGMVTGKAEDIATKVEVALNNIVTLTSTENINTLLAVVSDISNLSRSLNAMVAENRANLQTFTGQLANETPQLYHRAGAALARLDSSVSALEKLTGNKALLTSFKNLETLTENLKQGFQAEQMQKTFANVNRTLDNASVSVQEFGKTMSGSRDRLNTILDRLDATSRNLADFTNKIKQNPSLLIRKQED